MAVRTIVGVIIETEADEEEEVAVAVETETDTYWVSPPEMAEELLDYMGHRVQVSGTVSEEEDGAPVVEVMEYSILYDTDEDEEEEDEEDETEGFEELHDDLPA